MKQVKKMFALLFVIAALCFTGVTAFAQAGAAIASPPTAYNESAEAESDEEPVIEMIEPAVPERPEESSAPQQEAVAEQNDRGGNTPYFVGAGIAVLVFIGVAVFCKIKGKN